MLACGNFCLCLGHIEVKYFLKKKLIGSFKVAIIQTIICSINFPIKSFSGPFFD